MDKTTVVTPNTIPAPRRKPWKYTLARTSVLGKVLYSPWPVFLTRAVTLAGFVVTILAGLFGSLVGSHNFAIIFVWIAWWTLLKLVFIPLGGRSWCAMCPIPMPGEWLTQGSILPAENSAADQVGPGQAGPGQTGRRRFGLGLTWPKKIGPIPTGGSWMQAFGFLAVGLFSAATLTTPRLTGWVLLGIFVLATVMAVLFEDRDPGKPNSARADSRRAFCNHLCPIGGFTGLYASAAPVEVRVVDQAVCAAHAEKTCYQACPWGVYVTALQDNADCGLCMECVRACPSDNVRLNLRSFGQDYLQSRRLPRPDEAFLALVMLGCALAFSAVFLGPWGALRRAAYAVGSTEWLVYGASFLLFAGLLVPGLYALAIRLGGPVKLRTAGGANGKAARLGEWIKAASRYARPLYPLGLAAWVAFTISFAFAKASYVLPVVSDPFGLGWNLFGTASTVFNPDVSLFSPIAQSLVLLVGLLFSGRIARQDSGSSRRALAVQIYLLLLTLGMLVLLVG